MQNIMDTINIYVLHISGSIIFPAWDPEPLEIDVWMVDPMIDDRPWMNVDGENFIKHFCDFIFMWILMRNKIIDNNIDGSDDLLDE